MKAGAIAYSMGSVEIFGFSDVPQSDQGLKYGKVAELVLRSAQYDKERKRESGSEKVMRDKSVAGTASSQTGGKFQNGALTTGFQYLYNQVASSYNRRASTWDRHTNRRIAQLNPKIRDAVTGFINEVDDQLGIQLRVTDGFRSFAEQDALYAQGRTAPGDIVTNARGGERYKGSEPFK